MGDVHYMNPTNADEGIRRRAFRERERARRRAVKAEEHARRREIWTAEIERRELNRTARLVAGEARFSPGALMAWKVAFAPVWVIYILGGIAGVVVQIYIVGYLAWKAVTWILHVIGA
ncbi:hypothetical protein ACN2C7_10895 [Caulobacter sp. ErkDOM-E]|uniref:hypothetical protein n=1 Tax=Caulobacter sp. ErkDOM-E TaxID=3402778 RepID=UPI003AF63572